jgi:hypothetical protein
MAAVCLITKLFLRHWYQISETFPESVKITRLTWNRACLTSTLAHGRHIQVWWTHLQVHRDAVEAVFLNPRFIEDAATRAFNAAAMI